MSLSLLAIPRSSPHFPLIAEVVTAGERWHQMALSWHHLPTSRILAGNPDSNQWANTGGRERAFGGSGDIMGHLKIYVYKCFQELANVIQIQWKLNTAAISIELFWSYKTLRFFVRAFGRMCILESTAWNSSCHMLQNNDQFSKHLS